MMLGYLGFSLLPVIGFTGVRATPHRLVPLGAPRLRSRPQHLVLRVLCEGRCGQHSCSRLGHRNDQDPSHRKVAALFGSRVFRLASHLDPKQQALDIRMIPPANGFVHSESRCLQ